MESGERDPKRIRVSEDMSDIATRQGFEIVEPSFLDALSDVETAVSLILNRVPQQNIYPKMIIKHQLYCIIRNKTEIEAEIESLKNQRRIRVFSFPNKISYLGIMLQQDYDKDLHEVAARLLQAGNKSAAGALMKFRLWLTGNSCSSVFEEDLVGSVNTVLPFFSSVEDTSSSSCPSDVDSADPQAGSPPLTSSEVRDVVAAGFLLPKRNTRSVGMYIITHPQIGELSCAIEYMSENITKAIKKSRYKEVAERTLVGIKGAHGFVCGKRRVPKDGWVGLGWKYHIYDMVGRGDLMRIKENVTQPIIRLSGDA